MVRTVLAPIVDFALPPRCAGCGQIVPDPLTLCAGCWGKLELLTGKGCDLCGVPLPDPLGICAPCLVAPPDHDGAAAATAYGDVSRTIILKLKHGRKIGLAALIGRLMHAHLPAGDDWVLLPVPLHRVRLWNRGFNQSALIAREIAKQARWPVDTDLLVRTKRTPKLGGRGAAERRRLVSGSVAVSRQHAARAKAGRFLLIDDVYTSGATANACARALKRAGALEVQVLCWARVLLDD